MTMHLSFAVVIVALVGQCLAESHPWVAEPRDANWLKRHQELVTLTRQHAKEEKITFIGDSITEAWAFNGKNQWAKFYAPRQAYNYGVAGDQTQHVLYRIANGEFDGITAKVAVLLIGTNNLDGNSVDDIARGVKEILTQLQVKMPTTKIILLGVFPRGEPLGSKAKQLNVLLEKFGDNRNVFWLNMWNAFVTSDGKLKPGYYFPDNLHLLESGYQAWQETMEPLLKKLDPNF